MDGGDCDALESPARGCLEHGEDTGWIRRSWKVVDEKNAGCR